MKITEKRRDTYVDFLRGIAMLLVVLGHTMAGSAEGSQNGVLFNIVWSLQIPLFVVISGYVTRYGSVPTDAAGLLKLLGRRTLAYLLPWFVFTILINGLILQKQTLTAESVFWHMDSGYWFLITIWFISVIYILSRFCAEKLCRRKAAVPAVVLGFYLVGMAVLAGLGYMAGLKFLCIKLTLYYMPFFFSGYLFGVFQDKFKNRSSNAISVVVAVCTAGWLIAIVKLDLYSLSDTSMMDILLRAGTSLCGCIAVCGLFHAFSQKSVVYRFVNWFGRHTIEVFLLHYYVLNLINFSVVPVFRSARGIALTAVNYLVTVIIVSVMIKLLCSNCWLDLVLFGKLPNKKQAKG